MSTKPTLLFDGDCAFCSSAARFAGRILGDQARVLPYQRADVETLGITAAEGAEAVWWIEPGGGRFRGHEAVARSLRAAGGAWRRIGSVILTPVVAPVSARVYAWVARNRHRLPGGTPACRMPEVNSGS